MFLRKVHKKTPALQWILIKMQPFNLQFEILIKKEILVFSREFGKSFKDKFFIEQLRRCWKVTGTWNITLYFISKKKKMKLKTRTMNFLNFLSKRNAIWISVQD